MTKQIRPIAILLSILLLVGLQVSAQDDDDVLEYGDTVLGEITNSEYEVEYTFSGSAGDVIIIEMIETDILGELYSPSLILLNPRGRVHADTSDGFSFGKVILATELLTSGEYTIIATRLDGRTGDSVGEYTLELILPDILSEDESVSGVVSTESGSEYFLITTNAPFTILYDRVSGNMTPEVRVNVFDDFANGLDTIAAAWGDELSLATLGTFSRGAPYIVSVGSGLFSFSFTEETAGFTIKLRIVE